MKRVQFLFGICALLAIACVWALVPSVAEGAVPQLINFQGILRDSGGNPVADGAYSVSFTIYDAASGGIALWTETQSVSTSGGLFAILLGSSNSVPDSVFQTSDRWLEIAVASDPEMSPRFQLVSVGYAYRVSSVDSASGGTIISKVSIGSGHTNTGTYAFVAGANNRARGAYSVVSGGGGTVFGSADSNAALGDYSVVGGGIRNTASGFAAAVGGGENNIGSGDDATVGSGVSNTASAQSATVGGGELNTASGDYTTVGGGRVNVASGLSATVGGGHFNHARGQNSVVAGGGGATAADSNSTLGDWSVVSGGRSNIALGLGSTIAGGRANSAGNAFYNTLGGGQFNTANGNWSTVAGGYGNTVSSGYGAVGGGYANTANGTATVGGGSQNVASGSASTVGGGVNNVATGSVSTIPGGRSNTAAGNYSLAAGDQAKAYHAGSFVWADSTDADFASTGINQFLIRASGGVGIGTNNPEVALQVDQDAEVASFTGDNNQGLRISGTNTNDRWVLLGFDGGQGKNIAQIGSRQTGTGSFLSFGTSSAYGFGITNEALTIDPAGNIGMGVPAPAHPLHLVNGAHCTAGGTWTNASSRSYKTDIQPLKNREYAEILEKLENLDVVRFRYKAEPEREHIGLIAEEVPDEMASVDRKGIPTADAIAFLTAALKAQQAQIENLKETVRRLQETRK